MSDDFFDEEREYEAYLERESSYKNEIALAEQPYKGKRRHIEFGFNGEFSDVP